MAVHAVGISRRGDGRLGYDNVVLIPFGPEYPFTNPNHESFLIMAAHIWLLIWFEILAPHIWLLLWLGYGSELCRVETGRETGQGILIAAKRHTALLPESVRVVRSCPCLTCPNVTVQTRPTTGQAKASVARGGHFKRLIVGRSLEPLVGQTFHHGCSVRWLHTEICS